MPSHSNTEPQQDQNRPRPSRRPDLANRRKALGFTQEAFGQALGVAGETVAAWERGVRTPQPSQRPKLAHVLQLTLAEVDRLIDPAATPIEVVGHPVPIWLTHYESLVEAAEWSGQVQSVAVPALLQTPAYAEAVERATEHPFSDEQVLERVERRLARQRALYRVRQALDLSIVLPEHIVRARVGGPNVMCEQLDHLLQAQQLPNVDLRVLPADERSTAIVNGFELLSRRGDTVPFMTITLDPGGVARYGEDPDLVAKFVAKFEHLARTALSPSKSTQFIHDLIRERTL